MDSDKDVTGIFEKRQYPLTLTIEGNGTIKEEIVAIASQSQYPSGTSVKLTPIPNPGWQFSAWKGDYNESTNPLVIKVDKSKNITATFEIKSNIPEVGNFFNGGIITNVHQLVSGEYQYSSNPSKPNFLIEKMSLDDISFSTIKDIITKTQNTKIGNRDSYVLLIGNNNIWTNLSDSLAKYNGNRLDKQQEYTVNLFLTDKAYYVEKLKYLYSKDRSAYFTEDAQIDGKARLAAQEFVINNNNPLPKIGDYYGSDPYYNNYLQAPPRIFSIDNTKRIFKVFQKSSVIGYINYENLTKYIDKLPYNLGNGFRIPTMEELNLINTEFYLKDKLSWGNHITYSSNEDPNDKTKIQLFDFRAQKIDLEIKNSTFLRVSSPLIIKEIAY
jgi:hypothetical protein